METRHRQQQEEHTTNPGQTVAHAPKGSKEQAGEAGSCDVHACLVPVGDNLRLGAMCWHSTRIINDLGITGPAGRMTNPHSMSLLPVALAGGIDRIRRLSDVKVIRNCFLRVLGSTYHGSGQECFRLHSWQGRSRDMHRHCARPQTSRCCAGRRQLVFGHVVSLREVLKEGGRARIQPRSSGETFRSEGQSP